MTDLQKRKSPSKLTALVTLSPLTGSWTLSLFLTINLSPHYFLLAEASFGISITICVCYLTH
ncbi:hypothetical protein DDB_G0285227 [Dictyostelium discoideum AX4]|uniref:hypothetical protein n=1 Tax=Dictyostelium discoideum AX4 TaxID=352472 RepID=UPI00004E42B4|nr:hypothetical protein DDB_G0285227 [Dictyostelium discoideum AX4]EAL64825.1 hypothetical protein DDB_G0285227 [Dictyostelium discoideum AX4]|eukprot:XP_638338.1 hypothetical protein DDB_G0285227 [Dictyostelium discoideum AX4]